MMPFKISPRLFVPGLVFQAVVMGAGYATGRELVQFFMGGSLATGLAGLAVTASVFSLVMVIALGNARTMDSVDYRTFLQSFIGRNWVFYELCYAALLLIVLSVLASAAGEIGKSQLGIASWIGSATTMAAICSIVFFGTHIVEKFLATWSVLLYLLFTLILLLCLSNYGSRIATAVASGGVEPTAIKQGIFYAGYNVAVVPAILYSGRRLRSRSEAIVAGLLAGPIAVLPGILFYLSMSAFIPQIRSAPVPIDYVLNSLGRPWLNLLFYTALFGIFIKTGAALIHAVNERIESRLRQRGRGFSRRSRSFAALAMIAVATALGQGVGIVRLIAQGYQWLTIAFLLVFVLPLIVIGGYRMWSTRCEPTDEARALA